MARRSTKPTESMADFLPQNRLRVYRDAWDLLEAESRKKHGHLREAYTGAAAEFLSALVVRALLDNAVSEGQANG